MQFQDRRDAGKQLAAKLAGYADDPSVLVLGLPRGGVPVAYEVARALHAPLDVLVVRKLGVPGHRELAMGAIASGGLRVLNADVTVGLRISPAEVESVAARELLELERQQRAYRCLLYTSTIAIFIRDHLAAPIQVDVRAVDLAQIAFQLETVAAAEDAVRPA